MIKLGQVLTGWRGEKSILRGWNNINNSWEQETYIQETSIRIEANEIG